MEPRAAITIGSPPFKVGRPGTSRFRASIDGVRSTERERDREGDEDKWIDENVNNERILPAQSWVVAEDVGSEEGGCARILTEKMIDSVGRR